MYSNDTRQRAIALISSGMSLSEVGRRLKISRAALREWRDDPVPARLGECAICDAATLDEQAYAALLGFYLGDGCISRAPRCHVLRVCCDARYPGILEDTTDLATRIRRVRRPSASMHRDGRRISSKRCDYPRWQFTNNSFEVRQTVLTAPFSCLV